jgi:hypothetical protein
MAQDLPQKPIKTPCCGKLYWVKGIVEENGVLNELSNKYERSVTIRHKKDLDPCKRLIAEIDKFWKEARKELGIKQKEPKSTIYKPVLDDEGNETDEIEFKFKTNAKFPNGKVNWVKVFNAKGQDVTESFVEKGTLIGNDSIGIIHGSLAIYTYAKQYGITGYLTAIQLAKLVEYNPNNVEPEDLTQYTDEADFEAPEGGTSALPKSDGPDI